MRNIWQIPSAPALQRWCERCGFEQVQICGESETSAGIDGEQRQSEWMCFDSLEEALDPVDPTLTVEGHPRPRRVVIRAQKPLSAQE